jgi:hypothetical protein
VLNRANAIRAEIGVARVELMSTSWNGVGNPIVDGNLVSSQRCAVSRRTSSPAIRVWQVPGLHDGSSV